MTPFDIEPVSFINIVGVILINSVLYLLSHFCHSSRPPLFAFLPLSSCSERVESVCE